MEIATPMASPIFCSISVLPSKNPIFSFTSYSPHLLVFRTRRQRPVTLISGAHRKARPSLGRELSENDMSSVSVSMTSPPQRRDLEDEPLFDSRNSKCELISFLFNCDSCTLLLLLVEDILGSFDCQLRRKKTRSSLKWDLSNNLRFWLIGEKLLRGEVWGVHILNGFWQLVLMVLNLALASSKML